MKKEKIICKGYVAQLNEWEDAGYALFNEPMRNNYYDYTNNPSYDLMNILENYIGKNIKITIENV